MVLHRWGRVAFALLLLTATTARGSSAGLLLHWAFEEGEGSVTSDLSPNGRDGQLEGASWSAGPYGRALSLDGAGMVRTTPEQTPWFGAASFSGFAWVRSTDVRTDQLRILGVSFEQPQVSFVWFNFGAGTPRVELQDIAGRYSNVGASAASVADGGWHHLGFAVDRDRRRLDFFIDGERVSGVPLGTLAEVGTQPSRTGFAAGGQPQNSAAGLRAEIDEVRLYDRALTIVEVRLLAATHDAGSPATSSPAPSSPSPSAVDESEPGPKPASLRVGCACSSTPAGSLVAVMIALGRLSRRRRQGLG